MSTDSKTIVISTTDKLIAYRIEIYEGLGFNSDDAKTLASTRDDQGSYVNWRNIRKALRAGCTTEQAMKIWQ
jgi:hypothetical protein